MQDIANLWNLMRMPMQRWWERTGRWLGLPVLLLSLGSALHFMLMPNMPLYKWLFLKGFASHQLLDSLDRFLDIPVMWLLYAFIGLWASAAISCSRQMDSLLQESAAPAFMASPLQRLLVSYGQGLVLLPVALIVYSGLGLMAALAARVSPHSLQSVASFGIGAIGSTPGSILLPQHYTGLVESISQYSASAFAIASISLWITALAVAGGSLVGGGFLAMRSLDVGILSMSLLGGQQLAGGYPLIREAVPRGEFWLCIPLLLGSLLLLARGGRGLQRLALAFLAMLALSWSLFTTVMPRSLFLEDTLFAHLLNSMRFMYFGIGGPVFQVRASVSELGNTLRFREHLVLYSEQGWQLLSCNGSGVMLAWLGNLLVLLVLFALVATVVHLGVPQRRSIA